MAAPPVAAPTAAPSPVAPPSPAAADASAAPPTPAPPPASVIQAQVPPVLFVTSQLETVQSQVGSGRVKYSCIDVSPRLLLLGANTGSIYMFSRPNIEFLRLWSHTDIRDCLSCIKISPSEKLFAVSSVRGQIYIIQMGKPGEKDQVLLKVADHKEAEITTIIWQDNASILSGDDAGCVFLSSLANAGMFFQADLLYKTDSRVVQLDVSGSRVLVSSLTKCSVLDVAKRSATHVGTRARDGRFGGVFLGGSEQLLAARPGKRLWLAESSSGRVLNTLTFTSAPATQACNFTRLLPFGARVATWDEAALFVLNVAEVSVSAEYAAYAPLVSAAVCDSELFVVGGGGRVVAAVQALPPRDYVQVKAGTAEWRAALDAALTHRVLLLPVLRSLQQKLLAADANAADGAALALLVAEAEAAEAEQIRKEKEAAQKRAEEEEARRRKAEEERVAREREAERRREEKRKADEEARRVEEERRKAEEERKRRADDERRKLEEERRKADEERRKADDERRKVEEERRKADEERRKAERAEEAARKADEADRVRRDSAELVSAPHPLASSTPLPESAAATPSEPEPMPASQPEPLAVKRTRRLKRTIDVMPVSSGPAPAVAASASTDRPPQLVHSHSMPAIDRAAFAAAGGAPPRIAPPSPTVEPLVAAPTAPRPASDAAGKPTQAAPAAAPPVSPAVAAAVPAPPPAVPTPPAQPPAQGAGQAPPPSPTATALALERTLSLSALSLSSASQLLSNTKSLVAPLDQLLNAVDRIVPLPPVAAAKSVVAPTPTPTPTPLASAAAPVATPAPSGTAAPPAPSVLTSSGGASAPSQPAPVSAPPAAAAADSRPHLLTQTVHEAVQLWRTTMRVGQLPALLSHWLASYDPAAPPPRVPSAWLTEILTANFEINSRTSWTEEAALEYLAKHGAQLDCSAVLATANRAKWARVAAAALEAHAKQTPDPITAAVYATLQRHLSETLDVKAALEILKSQGNWVWMAQSVPRLLELKPQAAVALAVSAYPALQPWKMTEFFGGNEPAMREYLSGLASNEEVRASEELMHLWLGALLRDAPPADQLFISIGMPKRGALSVAWPQQARLDELLTRPDYYTYSTDEALLACKNAGYFRGVLQLASRQNNSALELEVALQVDDLAAFDGAARRTSSEAVWQSVLTQAMQLREVDQRRGEAEARRVSKERVVAAVLATMGPEAAAELLLRDEAFVDDVAPHAFPAFVTAFERQAEERAVVHKMLEALDAFMWTPKPLALAPQLKSLRDAEQAGAALQTPFVAEADGRRVVAFDETPLPDFLEQRHHWGVEFSTVGRCPGCTLSLREEVGANLVVFRCGHAYHQPCVTEEACRVCFLARSASLLRPGQFPLP